MPSSRPPGDLPDPRVKPSFLMSPALAGGFFFLTTSATWEAHNTADRKKKNNTADRFFKSNSMWNNVLPYIDLLN